MIQGIRSPVAAPRFLPGEDDDELATTSSAPQPGFGATDRAGLSSRSWWMGSGSTGSLGVRPASDRSRSVLPSVVHAFTAAWELGESPSVEDYLHHLDPADVQGAVDLIYREYCLAEADGRAPVADAYLARFPRYAEPLRSLFEFHGACSPSLLHRLLGPPPPSAGTDAGRPWAGLPEAGDSIGPYVLRRELGRGSFARVFLAEQSDLADRLVVVKIATRATREPWLLARARHAHIVEILSHAEVDDGAFQLICMPFWGGATLADVLAAPAADARQGPEPGSSAMHPRRGRRPTTGADLLAALDAVAAPEYPSVHPARPAREILAPLSYDRAIAWVVARLAEALDHASSRDVAHGDVKPSNILLSADGNPMLLDFNLARDDAPALDPSGRPIDPGGTLAYMAPERLRALALSAGSAASPGRHPGSFARDGGHGAGGSSATAEGGWPTPDDRSAHVSDLYAMGMVLLESLTGRPPSTAPAPAPAPWSPEAALAGRAARLASTALAYAAARERPARAMIRDFESASGRPIAPALRAILERCLDPDPTRRYRRALELAEDLDRWRTDRPLAYADEPFWGQAVPRWLRVRRRMLIVAAASILALGLATTALVLAGSNRLLHRDVATMALGKLAQWWDEPEFGAFLRNQREAAPHAWVAEDHEAFEVARRALADYGVIGPDGGPADGDWRLRDDVRYLPPADRDDLDLWLLERAYRYCLALADRPGTPDDRQNARRVLDRVVGQRSIRAFAPLKDRLAARPEASALERASMDKAGPNRGTAGEDSGTRRPEPAPAWLDEHLLGFVAEGRSGLDEDDGPIAEAGSPEGEGRRADIERALGHYDRALAGRPGSFWAHHRAASACFGLGRPSEAAYHLAQCLDRRPGNAVVRAQLARCLIASERYPEALEQCDRALEQAPKYAELYRARALTRTLSRRTGGVADDLQHFEMFSRVLPASFWGGSEPGGPLRDAGLAFGTAFPGLGEPRAGSAGRRGRDEPIRFDSEDVEARAAMAGALLRAEMFPLARAEIEKILVIKPDHIRARIMSAERAIEEGRFDAGRSDIGVVFDHPGLESYVRGDAGSLTPLLVITRRYLNAGRVEDARWVIERVRDLAIQFRRDVGRSHYHSAQVYAVLGASEPEYIDQAAKQLFRASIAHPTFLEWYRNPNPWFDPVRTRIDVAMGRMEDPATVRSRKAARASARSLNR